MGLGERRIVASAPLMKRQKTLIAITDGTDSCMNTSIALRIHGELDIPRLRQSIRKVIANNDALRLVFVQGEDGEVWQHVLEECWYEMEVRHVEGATLEVREQLAVAQFSKFLTDHKKLDGNRMFDFVLFDLQEEKYLFLANMNHLITDGIGNMLTISKIVSAYNDVDLPENNKSYMDFLDEEMTFAQSDVGKAQMDYWYSESKGYKNFIELPKENRRKSKAAPRFTLELQAVQDFARAHKTSPFVVSLFLFHASLSATYGVMDTAINFAEGNRSREFRQTLGYLTTPVFHRLRIGPEMTIRHAFELSKTKSAENMNNSRLGSLAKPSMFLITYQNYRQNQKISFGKASAEPYPGIFGESAWDFFTLLVGETEDKLVHIIACDEDVFPATIMEKFSGYYKLALQCLIGEDMTFADFCKSIT